LVGYFVLGPSDLYKLVKEIGKFIQNARTLGTDLTTTFESNMESQLQLEELRKAQRELNDAFSFRRTINVDRDSEAFSTTVDSPRQGLREGSDVVAGVVGAEAVEGAAAGATAAKAAATAAPPKKKIRRRIRVKRRKAAEEGEGDATTGPTDGTVPDLEMPADDGAELARSTAEEEALSSSSSSSYSAEELAEIESEFDQYAAPSAEEEAAAQQRFQQQLTGDWNEQVLANEDKLSPIAQVMQKLALLEEEKIAATKRLQEEFEQRTEIEEKFYREQRKVLEEAAREVQQEVYAGVGDKQKPE